jgi:hypothetical protein
MRIDTKGISSSNHYDVKEIKNGLQFLCKPILKKMADIPHVYDNHVLNDGEHWYSTDGHRLHKIDMDGFGAPGVYKVIKNTKTRIILEKTEKTADVFPNMQSVFPYLTDAKEIDCQEKSPYIAYANIIRAMADNKTLNYHFLEDIFCDNFTAYITDSMKPIVFKNGTKTALIMPMAI